METGEEIKRTTVKHYFIERSEVEDDLKMLLEEEQKFWKYVESGRMLSAASGNIKEDTRWN